MNPFLKKVFLQISVITGINFLLSLLLEDCVFLVGYHSIRNKNNEGVFKQENYEHVSISEDKFKEHLEYLKKRGHNFVSVSELSDAINKKIKKPTVIYFDDGYKDTLSNALPILEEKNIPATVFLTIDLLSGKKKLLRGFKEDKDPFFTPFLDWKGAEELVKKGVDIGSHGISHKKLTNCTNSELVDELTESKRIIEERFGRNVISFSYPHGRANDEVVARVKEVGYTWGLTTREGINTRNYILEEPYLLNKVEPRPKDTLLDFKSKLYSGSILAFIRKKINGN